MILWTIQPDEVYQEILTTGVYHCDFTRSMMYDYKSCYDWLVKEMTKRIGPPPEGVSYPVWAWYQWEGKRKKPDLRRERWKYSPKGIKYACMEIDIPEDKVILHDFDTWSLILLDALISENEKEDKWLENQYESLDEVGKKRMKDENWKRVFDISLLNNHWIIRGSSIQATFWELRREQIKDVRFFVSAKDIPER